MLSSIHWCLSVIFHNFAEIIRLSQSVKHIIRLWVIGGSDCKDLIKPLSSPTITHPISPRCSTRPANTLYRRSRWREITQTASRTSQETLSLGTISCPSASREPHFRNEESRRGAVLPGAPEPPTIMTYQQGTLNAIKSNNVRLNVQGKPPRWFIPRLTFSVVKQRASL